MSERNVMNTKRAAKIAAKRLGISAAEYTARRAAGNKWCWSCREWHRFDAFNADRTNRDGMANICRAAKYHRYPQTNSVSLTAFTGRYGGGALVEVVPDQATVFDIGQIDAADRLRAIVGDMEPEDVRLLDSASLERLRDRLRDEGLVPRGVLQKERVRLAAPDTHTGERISAAPLIPGRKTRRQKIAHKEANRNSGNSNRPKQKPRKRWTRDKAA